MRLLQLTQSPQRGKRLRAWFEMPDGRTKAVDFGAAGGKTFIDHGDTDKRRNYLARHGASTEDWTKPDTPGALSRWLLWGDSPWLADNLRQFVRRFGLA